MEQQDQQGNREGRDGAAARPRTAPGWAHRLREGVRALDRRWLAPWLNRRVRLRPEAADVLVIAHRGGAGAPENTRAAFRRILAREGIDGVECDVLFTRDTVPVVSHHSRIPARWPGGEGLATIRDLDAADVVQLEVGSRVSEEYRGECVPTLRDVLELLKGKVRRVYLHDKAENRRPEPEAEAERVRAFAGAIRAAGMAEAAVVMAECGDAGAWRAAAPDIAVLTCWTVADHQDYHVKLADAGGPEGRHAGVYDLHGQLRPLGRWLAKAGLPSLGYVCGFWPRRRDLAPYLAQGREFVVFTVDDPLRMKLYANAGFRAIGTNHPERLVPLREAARRARAAAAPRGAP